MLQLFKAKNLDGSKSCVGTISVKVCPQLGRQTLVFLYYSLRFVIHYYIILIYTHMSTIYIQKSNLHQAVVVVSRYPPRSLEVDDFVQRMRISKESDSMD